MIRHEDTGHLSVTLLLAGLLWLGPIRFGGVLPPDRAILDVTAFLALVAAIVRSLRLDELRPGLGPALAVAAVAGLGLLQSVPLPRPAVALVSPRAAELWTESQSLLALSSTDTHGAALSNGGPAIEPEITERWTMPLSLAPAASRASAWHWLAVAAALLAAVAAGRHRGARRFLAASLVGSALFQVLFGAGAWSGQKTQILGVEVPGDPGRLRGTFVNPDHFAFFVGLAVACAFAWAWWTGRRLTSRRVAVEVGSVRLLIAVLVFFTLFIGLALSGSRSGLLACLATLTAQGAVIAHKYRRFRGVVWGATGLALAGLTFVLFGARNVLGRWMETSAYELGWNARVGTWRDTLELWLGFPVLGTGLGSFRFALPLTQSQESQLTWIHAHSDWLELLATVGLAGAGLFVAGLGVLCWTLWQAAHRGRRSEDRALALAALGALVYAAFHSLADFGLTLPANAFALAVLAGIAAAVPTGRRASSQRSGLTVHLEDQESATLRAGGPGLGQGASRSRPKG